MIILFFETEINDSLMKNNFFFSFIITICQFPNGIKFQHLFEQTQFIFYFGTSQLYFMTDFERSFYVTGKTVTNCHKLRQKVINR